MRIELNGATREVRRGSTISDAISAAGADPKRRGIAVALDGEVVPRVKWTGTELREGQRIEIVEAIQGG